jgi:hypothetical protein
MAKKTRDEYDWVKMKSDYVTSNKSLRKIGEEYGVAHNAVSRHASLDKWVEARKKYREKTIEKVIEKSSETTANKLARIMKSADALAETVEVISTRGTEVFDYISENGNIATDTKAIKDLAVTLRELTAVIRNVYDIPTSAEIETRRLAAERLNLEREKFEREKNEIDMDVRIVFGNEIENYAE